MNRELAKQIYETLNARGAGLGDASISIIEGVIDRSKIRVVKSLDPGSTELQISGGGTTNFCSWDRLKPHLAEVAGSTRRNEKVIGVIATKEGVEIRLSDNE